MAQVVQADGRQPGEVGEHVEGVGDRGRVQRVPGLVGELEPGIGPGVPGGFLLFVLLLPPQGQVGDGLGVEGDGALAGVGLGGALDGVPAELGDLPADGAQGGPEVGVGAAQPAALAPAQAPGGDQPPQGVQPVPAGGFEEHDGLGGGPDHDRRRARDGDPDVDRADPPARRAGGGEPRVEVLLPGPDPLIGPDQGLGPGAGRQLDEGGDVGGQRAGVLLHVGADRRAEGGADPLAGGRANPAAALDGGAGGRAAGGAGLGDGVVEFLDVVEHRGDVGDPEPVDGDVPEVGLEVEADVPGVAADGAFGAGDKEVDVLSLAGQPAPDGGVVSGADLLADPDGVGKRAGLAHRGADGVGDPDGCRQVTGRGDGQQLPGQVQLRLGGGVGGEAAAGQRVAPPEVGAGRELDLVVPGAVPVAPGVAATQLGALAAERLAGGLVAAAAQLEGCSVAHQVLFRSGLRGGRAGLAGGPGVPVESAGRGAWTRGSPPPVKRGGRAGAGRGRADRERRAARRSGRARWSRPG